MRLLDTATGEFHWMDSPTERPYAILSHTWVPGAEQSYQDILRIQQVVKIYFLGADIESTQDRNTSTVASNILSSSEISSKIKNACAIALADGYELLWVDSCCIDKSSSAELSEAINSMYNWYRHAKVCYVYLADVDDNDVPETLDSQFRRARWHTRGWTLQELIAPRYVVFFSKGWRVLGTKNTLGGVVEEVTGIDHAILNHEVPLQSVSVARRMWWASARVTSRVEDEAYALMGIFDINMPTIYGEGRQAFVRLQEEILKVVPDQSIFAWAIRLDPTLLDEHDVQKAGQLRFWQMLNHEGTRHSAYTELQVMFASSPSAFATSAHVRVIPHRKFLNRLHFRNGDVPPPQYTMTSLGICTQLALIPIDAFPPPLPNGDVTGKVRAIVNDLRLTHTSLAILECEDSTGRLLVLPMFGGLNSDFVIGAKDYPWRVLALEPADLNLCLPHIAFSDILVRRRPSPQSVIVSVVDAVHVSHEPGLARILVHGWCRTLLAQQGFSVVQTEQDSALIAEHSTKLPFPSFLYGYVGHNRGDTWEEAALRHKDHVIALSSSTARGREHINICIGTHYRTNSVITEVRYQTGESDSELNDGKVSYADGVARPQSLPDGMRFPASDGAMWAISKLEGKTGMARTLRLSFARSQSNQRELELVIELSALLSVAAVAVVADTQDLSERSAGSGAGAEGETKGREKQKKKGSTY